MAADTDDQTTTGLGRALRDLRNAAKLRQLDVVARAGISQARLSRIEQGKSVPAEADTLALAKLYSATTAQREQLLAMTRDAIAGVRDTRLVVQRGNTFAMQRRWRRIEADAQVVREYHPALILGSLQTPEYSAFAMDEHIDSAAVRDRQLRRQSMLTRPTPRFEFIQTEGALRYRVGSATLMSEQLDAILAASERPNVEFGVIPFWRSVDVTPVCGFSIYDDQAAAVGLEVAAARLTGRDDVAEFRRLFDQLAAVAVWGDEARVELHRIIAETV